MSAAGASAPGKALLCGEYCVLQGGPAVVAAVDRRASAMWTDQPQTVSPEVESTLALARSILGELPGSLRIGVGALQSAGRKLGLGSSAAAAVAAAGAAFERHGHDLSDPSVRERVFDCAFRGHAAVAPQGSGVDVAASTFGGFLRFERRGDQLSQRRLELPPGLVLRLVWTGQPVRTSDLLRKVHRFRDREPEGYSEIMKNLIDVAERFATAFEAGATRTVVDEAAAYGEAMDGLGRAAGAPIVEQKLEATSVLARRFSGASKPCGAGGGDVAVAFFLDQTAADSFDQACSKADLHPIEVAWGEPGVGTTRD